MAAPGRFMPNYDYKCDGCGSVQERRFSMATRPQTIPCPECGAEAEVQISCGIAFFAKGREWDWDTPRSQGRLLPSMGRYVRSDDQQGALYDRMVNEAKVNAKRKRRDLGRKEVQFEHVGRTPLEVHEGVVETLGDKEAWQKDPEGLLKRTGCWLGE